mmetsp:Transcript_8558/g.23164  ORF Transcript_8558/g.23164 Transcript_8558/m.23164 type:complete len:275 (+) Transcript_8558:1550-2374(+)
MVPRDGRQGSLPDRRHLVADRDGRAHDCPVADRLGGETGIGVPAVLRRGARACQREGRGARRRGRGLPVHQVILALGDPICLRRPGPLRDDLLRPVPRLLLLGRRRTARSRRIHLDHGPRRRRDQRVRPPHRLGRGRIGPRRARQLRRGRRRRLRAPGQGTGHMGICDARRGCRAQRRSQEGARRRGSHADWPLCFPRHHPLGALAPQDSLWKDHAAGPAKDRQFRGGAAGRHVHPGRPQRGRNAHPLPRQVTAVLHNDTVKRGPAICARTPCN